MWDRDTGQPLAGDLGLRVWKLATGARIYGPLVLSAQARAPTRRRYDAGCERAVRIVGNTAVVTHFTDGHEVHMAHNATIQDAHFSPDGRRLVTASADLSARVWETQNGLALTPRLRHNNLVSSAMFSPNGLLVATSSHDRTARLWDAKTGQPVSGPLPHDYRVEWVRFSPNGQTLYSCDAEFPRAWTVRPDAATPATLQDVAGLVAGFRLGDGGLPEYIPQDELKTMWQRWRIDLPAFAPDGPDDRLAPAPRGG